MKTKDMFFVAVAVIAAAAGLAEYGKRFRPSGPAAPAVDSRAMSWCKRESEKTRRTLDSFAGSGLARYSVAGTHGQLQIDDTLWQAMTDDQRRGAALAIWCLAMPIDGQGAATVRGAPSNVVLLRVQNGFVSP